MHHFRALLPGLFSLLLASACAHHPAQPCPKDRAVRVFYATDRKRDEADPRKPYGSARTDPPALQMGWQPVAVGAGHRIGLLDRAVTLTPAQEEYGANPKPSAFALHRTDAEIFAFTQSTLRTAVRAVRPAAKDGKRIVLLFVHGYNNTYDYAVRKTAQLAGDLDLITCDNQPHGVPVMYSWPAEGTLLSYLADEENAEWTQQRLVPFIQALALVCREEHAELHIVAHSMGCRAVVRSLAEIVKSQPRSQRLVSQLVLLAPDIGRGLFDQYVERFLPVVEHLTIYVSGKDRALKLSTLLHGGHGRLGLLETTVTAALRIATLGNLGGGDDARSIAQVSEAKDTGGKIDMVDVTGGLTDFIGHSYEGSEFIHDLQELIYRNTPAGTAGRSNLEAKEISPSLFGLFGKKLRYFKLPTK